MEEQALKKERDKPARRAWKSCRAKWVASSQRDGMRASGCAKRKSSRRFGDAGAAGRAADRRRADRRRGDLARASEIPTASCRRRAQIEAQRAELAKVAGERLLPPRGGHRRRHRRDRPRDRRARLQMRRARCRSCSDGGQLQHRVIGHDRRCARYRMPCGVHARGSVNRRPIGSFLFLGPPCRKTETARASLSSCSTTKRHDSPRYDEYMERHAVSRLIALRPGTWATTRRSADRAGAHATLQRAPVRRGREGSPRRLQHLLQLLDDGRLTMVRAAPSIQEHRGDPHHQPGDAELTALEERRDLDAEERDITSQRVVAEALRQHFRRSSSTASTRSSCSAGSRDQIRSIVEIQLSNRRSGWPGAISSWS